MPIQKNKQPVRFVITFIILFLAFYYFNIGFFSVTSPDSGHYNAFLANHLNYISWLRWLLLKSATQIINWLGYTAISNNTEILVAGLGILRLVYTCLGLGIISFFTAFVLAYPKSRKARTIFLIAGIFVIELLNIIRLVLLALFWDKRTAHVIDHHTLFNIFIYLLIAISLYFWVNTNHTSKNAAN